MKKPLYLDAQGTLKVGYEAPVLTVDTDGAAQRWYPLTRLSRIISRGQVQWSGAALLACMAQAVPVLFLDAEGMPCGLCTGAINHIAGLDEHLRIAMASPAWEDAYLNWYRSQERRLIRRIWHKLGEHEPQLSAPVTGRLLQQSLSARHGAHMETRLGLLLALLRGHVHEELAQAGLDPALVCGLWGDANLGQEFTRLAAWELRLQLLLRRLALPGTVAQAAVCYQAHLEAAMTTTIDRLIAHLWRLSA